MSACLSAENALLISIDLPCIRLPDGSIGGGYPDWKIPLYKLFASKGQTVKLIRDDSHSERVFNELKKYLGDRTVDFMFIDGDPSYEGVKRDFDTYKSLLKKGSVVAFHDIASDKRENPDNLVSIFWDEIKNDYPHKEFINEPGQSQFGIGVLDIS